MFVNPYPAGVAPSQRLKYEQYYALFRERYDIGDTSFVELSFWDLIYKKGHFFTKVFYALQGYWKRLFLLFTLHRYDLVYVHLWVTPFGPPIFERLIRLLSKKLVYDIDDLIYLREAKSGSHWLVNYLKGYRKPLYLMRVADHVITCTPYLHKFARSLNTNTTDISSTVNTDLYIPRESYSANEPIVLGWSGSLSTSQYFLLLTAVLQRLAKEFIFKVVVMGDASIQIAGVDVESLPWSEKVELPTLTRFDIGLYPLPDEEWVYGKSGLKAIQYMALGIPTVATAIGANFRVIEHGVSGMLVQTDDEWYHALRQLMESEALRRELGQQGRKRVVAHYSMEANKHRYLKIFDNLICAE